MMNPSLRKRGALGLFLLVAGGLIFLWSINFKPARRPALAGLEKIGQPHIRSSFSPQNRDDAYARHEYEMRRWRDPQTGGIPDDMREKELAFARNLPSRERLLKNGGAQVFAADWIRRGPINVGGRTRALAIDLNYNGTTNRRILAGGVSGGMFLSEDDGANWKMTTGLAQLASVTCLTQDRNNRNVWYFGTGELISNSASGGGAFYFGQGIFKSTDGGNNWTPLASTIQNNQLTIFDRFFDFVWNIAIHPQSSTVFAATFGGLMRSTDGGGSWQQVLGRNQSPFSSATDVTIASDGTVYAALSRNSGNFSEYGVFRSTNNGDQFTVISPPGLSSDPFRMVLATAPSDPNRLYLLVQAREEGAVASDHQLFRYNAANNTWTDLSASLPNQPGVSGNASFSSQGGYDLIVKVKPDDPDVVWIGGTNLYRSTNAGQSFTLVGGYSSPSNYGQFANHHPDQHAITFFPNNPNAMISGHDGGLSKTTNVLAQPQTWSSLNNGYVTTQFYAVAVDPQVGSDFITGGTQDNGTWGTDVTNFNTPWASLLSGDGAYTDIAAGGNTFYVSAQMGFVIRARVVNNQIVFSLVKPATPNGERDFLFITPYQLDPNDSRVMYLAVANGVWRNSNLDGITVVNNNDPVTTNWSALDNSAVPNSQVTTLAISKSPANRLYFGATDFQSSPVIMRVDNAPSNPAGTNITPAGLPGGAYPSCIGINPNNADEIIAVFSNYRIPSLWSSSNGGGSWTNIEGNLAGDEGPSIRWATIVPMTNGKTYLLATSTGIYSTTALNGANTAWVQEGSTPIGNVVTDMIVARPADGIVVAGTHGRGVYSSQLAGTTGTANLNVTVSELNISLRPGTIRSAQFNLGNTGTAPLNYNITATGPTTGAFTARLNGFENDFIPNLPKFDRAATGAAAGAANHAGQISSPSSYSGIFLDDALVFDDGNNTADDFVGFGPNSANDFVWLNNFTLSGFGFRLETFDFYMRTESAGANPVYVAVLDANGNTLAQGNLNLATAPNGSWYTIMLNPALNFNDGQSFSILAGASRVIELPAGADVDAAVPNRSFYLNPSTNTYVNLNTISGFENAAFLIRARGTKTGGGNQPPIANPQVSPNPANVNQNVLFDASTSSDPDGQITQYLWNFGDGATSTQRTTTHAYAQAGTFTYTLTVTDNGGATDQASGQITIAAAQNRLTVNPASGTVAAGGSQIITVTFDAQGLAKGNYLGQLVITSNGGNRTLPVRILVSNSVKVDEQQTELPRTFELQQNYPNPFNPETTIRYSLPSTGEVSLQIYDVRGELIKTLVSGQKVAGEYTAYWDGRNNLGGRVASGIYFYRLEATAAGTTTNLTRKLTVMK